MFGSNKKAQKAANAMGQGESIIQPGSRGCCKPKEDSRQNFAGVQRGGGGGNHSDVPRLTHFMNLKRV